MGQTKRNSNATCAPNPPLYRYIAEARIHHEGHTSTSQIFLVGKQFRSHIVRGPQQIAVSVRQTLVMDRNAFPVCFGFSDNGWHGMVHLPGTGCKDLRANP